MRAQFRQRIRYIFLGILCVVLIILVRLYIVQIANGKDYRAAADAQYEANSASGLYDRGTIYFTRKDGTLISAATLEDGYLVAINPQLLTNPTLAYNDITAVVASTSRMVSKSDFFSDASSTNRVYIEVAHELPDSSGDTLTKENIPGVTVLRERWRFYPGGSLAAKTLGIVSYGSGSTLTGQTGLEDAYNSVLERQGSGLYSNFFAQLFSGTNNAIVDPSENDEGDIVTSIEPEVETRLADDLAKVSQQYSSDGTGGIIMDPHTGQIIALASYPTFNPNDLTNVNPELLRNPLVENVYEFGSIMKPLTMAAGLNEGVITPDSTYNDTGCITVDKAEICNYDQKARGITPMLQIIEQSLNVGASWIATQLGQTQFRNYFTKYFGTKTGVDLPRETNALDGNLNSTEQVNFDNMSFGQGIAVTPMQMVRALSSLANNGVMVSPHLVDTILLTNGTTKTLDWNTTVPLFSTTTVNEVTNMLETVFPNDAQLAMNSDPSISYPSVLVASKTGTAQVEKPGGGYYPNIFFHSYFGFFPADNPQFAILLYMNRPQGVEYASGSLTATFMDLINFLTTYYNIPAEQFTPPSWLKSFAPNR